MVLLLGVFQDLGSLLLRRRNYPWRLSIRAGRVIVVRSFVVGGNLQRKQRSVRYLRRVSDTTTSAVGLPLNDDVATNNRRKEQRGNN